MFITTVILLIVAVSAAALAVVLYLRAQAKKPSKPSVTPSELAELQSEIKEETQPLQSDNFGMIPVLPQYNAVIRYKTTASDNARLIRLKKGADAVYGYYDWVASDFRRVDDTKLHTNRIEELLQNVMACLHLSQFQKSLAGYFIVCVLSEIKEEFMASGPSNTMFPINLEALSEVIYNPEDVIDAVHQKPDHEAFYLAGIFIPENYDVADLDVMTRAAISRGAVVYSDDVLTTTNNLMDLVEAKYNKPYSEVDEAEHFEAFMDAIVDIYQVNEEYKIAAVHDYTPA